MLALWPAIRVDHICCNYTVTIVAVLFVLHMARDERLELAECEAEKLVGTEFYVNDDERKDR